MAKIDGISSNLNAAHGSNAAQGNRKIQKVEDRAKEARKLEERRDEVRSDQARVSDQAVVLSKMHAILDETPDVRDALVSNLKAQVDNGSYKIPVDEIAKRLAPTIFGGE